MRKLLAITAALALCACATVPTIPPAPAEVADQTTLDENAAIGVEIAYKAARIAIETLVDRGAIKGTLATRIAMLDDHAKAAVNATRAAYRVGNAGSYVTAALEAQQAVTALLIAIGGK